MEHSPDSPPDFDLLKDRVIQHLSHELKTPLAVLSACLKLLKKKLPQPPDAQWETIYARALRSLERLTLMEYEIEDILRQRNDRPFNFMSQVLHTASDSGSDAVADAQDEAGQFFRQVNIEFLIHELKDPLSIIETNATLLTEKSDRQPPLSHRQTNSLDRIVRNTIKARSMLWQLLEVGRAEAHCFHCRSFALEPVLREVVLDAVESNAPDLDARIRSGHPAALFDNLARNGIRLEMASGLETLQICHDEVKLRQIVANLVKNALDYYRRLLLIHLSVQHDRFTIAVRDDGPGIAPEHHEAVFQRFKQLMPQPGLARSGHGLGLAVSRILARSMGGDIILESQLGQGARFTVSLPLAFIFDGPISG
jgi:two-component system OmpR family sensor kinase